MYITYLCFRSCGTVNEITNSVGLSGWMNRSLEFSLSRNVAHVADPS